MDYSYQDKLVEGVNASLETHHKVLLAACPGAGKTRMTLRVIDTFLKLHPNARILILTHGQVLLREQWADVFAKHSSQVPFVVRSVADCHEANTQAIVLALPQTLAASGADLTIDLLIVDEAHHWYESPIVTQMVEDWKPARTLLLTGTPSLYLGDAQWKMHGITLQELLTKGVITDPSIELIKAHYQYDLSSYQDDMTLKANVKMSAADTRHTLEDVLAALAQRLATEKTMFVCRSQGQAKDVHEFFIAKGIPCALSISNTGTGIEELAHFTQTDCRVFIVVNRGVLGFDYDALCNLVDLSGTLNVNKLFQMLCRVVRTNRRDPSQQKTFIKIATPETAAMTYFVMSYVVALSDAHYYFSYKTNDTKSARVPVPQAFLDSVKRHAERGTGANHDKFPDLPQVLTFRTVKGLLNGPLHKMAITSFKEVRRLLYNQKVWNEATVRETIEPYETRQQFREADKGAYQAILRAGFLSLLNEKWPYEFIPTKDKSLEELISLALQYPSKSKFREAHHGAFKWLVKQGHIDKIEWPKGHVWTPERVLFFARKCTGRKDFKNKYSSAYQWAQSNNRLDILDLVYGAYLPRTVRWTVETALKEAAKYSKISEFKRHCSGGHYYLWAQDKLHLVKEVLRSKDAPPPRKAAGASRNYGSKHPK